MIGPLSYIGGKRRIAATLVSLIPVHTTYVEPFAGGAQVFFHKPRSAVEVLNDLDGEVVNFLRICQRHPEELSRLLRWQPASRRLFDQHLAQPPDLLTDVERAARFFYLQKYAWSGKRTRQSFRYAIKRSTYTPASLPKRLREAAERLDRVQLENRPYGDVLTRYDRPSTFFYCDPPYVGLSLYQHNFTDDQFEELAAALRSLQGRFLLSINDCPKSREWFAGFHSRTVELTYTSTRVPRRFTELLIANYPLETPTPP
ncbi:MAG TPA: DNA adenine methylase [Vicinamibacterales bacterium]|nr:DNA adenine methylase [Vicinamibacterales bacterium]